MTVFENITLKPKLNHVHQLINFKRMKGKNYIPINKEDSPQIIKMCCSSLHKMVFMVKNINKRWSIID